ncbi:MAG TPA: acyl-CoA dehydrogenase family protein [Dehalococcoidia bacterium]|nr:acyl-CoA dehydrogenase family protein [Dehalococcoidia bacterium]
MDFSFSPAQNRFRQEVRDFLREHLPAGFNVRNDREALSNEEFAFSQRFAQKLAAKGWLTMSWPQAYGGRAADPMDQLVYNEEMGYSGAPLGFGFGTNLVGPTLMVHGTEEQRRAHLPPIARAEVFWCQGFSEPGAGSDLAGLQTRAVRDGDEYVVNGQKIWTSEGHQADWMILLARTDVEAPKHKGISYFLVDMKTPGIQVRPLVNLMNSHAFNEVFFDNVRVPRQNLVGEENRGWYVATTTLDFERSGITRVMLSLRIFEDVVAFVREAASRGEAWAQAPGVKHRLADLRVAFEIARMLARRVAWQQSKGIIPNYESSMAKLFSSELNQRFCEAAINLLGPGGQLEPASKWAPLQGRIERAYEAALSYKIAGGTSEIQRNVIATRGLGLPRG